MPPLFINAQATPAVSTLSLHDALPIYVEIVRGELEQRIVDVGRNRTAGAEANAEGLGRLHAREHRRVEVRSEEHTSELQSRLHLVCRLLLEKKKTHRSAEGRPLRAPAG